MMNLMKRVVVFTVLLVMSSGLLSSALVGCTRSSSDEIRPAPIHEVQISIAKSQPPQIIIYIKGGLSDGCTSFNELKTNRSDTTVNISVTTKRPRNTACPAIYGFFEQTVNLGSDFMSGQMYTLKVNDYITTFEYPV
jgi:hypothetical protein